MTLEKGTLNEGEDRNESKPVDFLDTSKFSDQNTESKTDLSMADAFNKKMQEMTEEFNRKLEDQAKQFGAAATSGSSGFSKENAEMISMAVAQAMKMVNPKEIDSEIGMAEEEIPPGDYDKKGTRFCCPLVGYIVSDDIRRGQRVILPYKKKEVVFEYVSTRRIRTGKYEQIHPYSAYTSNSHRLTKWLREHSLYGTMFYETSTEAVHVDARKASRMADVMRNVRGYELRDLLKRCDEYGVSHTEDPNVMKQNLAYAIVMKEIDGEAESQRRSLEETYKHEKMFKGAGV